MNQNKASRRAPVALSGTEDERQMMERWTEDVALAARDERAASDRMCAAEVHLHSIPGADNCGWRGLGDWSIGACRTEGFVDLSQFDVGCEDHNVVCGLKSVRTTGECTATAHKQPIVIGALHPPLELVEKCLVRTIFLSAHFNTVTLRTS